MIQNLSSKPYFSDKHVVGVTKITLIESDKMTLDNESASKKFNNYFSKKVDSLDLHESPSKPRRKNVDMIDYITSKFKSHTSIVKVKKHFKIKTTFSFSSISKDN